MVGYIVTRYKYLCGNLCVFDENGFGSKVGAFTPNSVSGRRRDLSTPQSLETRKVRQDARPDAKNHSRSKSDGQGMAQGSTNAAVATRKGGPDTHAAFYSEPQMAAWAIRLRSVQTIFLAFRILPA